MVTEPTNIRATQAGETPRTGPIGRLARILLAALLGWLAYDLWVDRSFIFAEAEPGVLILTGLAAYGVHHTGALIGRGRQALAVLAATATVSAATALVIEGRIWAAPLNWFVWGLDLGILVFVAVALLAAVALGTPGCEVGVLRELPRLLRRGPKRAEVVSCLAGLHQLDAWEARRPWHRRGGTP